MDQRYWPAGLQGHAIHLDTSCVEGSLIDALNACASQRSDPESFLQELCEYFLHEYEADPRLDQPRAALNRVRMLDPSSGSWWTEFRPHEDTCGQYHCINFFPDWAEPLLYVKMSEYLCLQAYLEVLELARGQKRFDQ